MNGPHDMGGMQCYGPVVPEVDEPLFHGEWEKKAMAMTVALGFAGMWNLDASRFQRESLPPAQYTSSSYYQIWLAALEKLMLERGMITEGELASGKVKTPALPTKNPVPDAEQIVAGLAKGGPVTRDISRKAKFAVGDKVHTPLVNPKTHTRLPRYARDKIGEIIAINGAHVFPDDNSLDKGENPQWLYTVVFPAKDLFGEGSHEVMLDLFEPYLVATK